LLAPSIDFDSSVPALSVIAAPLATREVLPYSRFNPQLF